MDSSSLQIASRALTETRGPGLLITNIILASISFTLTVLRLYTRGFITATAGLDDVLIVVALLTNIAMCSATSLAAVQYGWGHHFWDVPLDLFTGSLKLKMVFQITFCASSTFTKLSLLWFCRRIIGNSKKFRNLNSFLLGTMLLLWVLGILFVFVTLFTCIPVKASFDVFPIYQYHCLNGKAVTMFASVANVLTDFLTTVIPMPLIWRLQLPRRQRLAVISMFGIGISVTIASSVRTYYAWMSTYGSIDSTWYGWALCLVASVEINIGLICASVPALRPFIKVVYPRLLASFRASGSASNFGSSNQQKLQPWQSGSASSDARIVNRSKQQESRIFNKPSVGPEADVVRTEQSKDYKHSQGPKATTHGQYEVQSWDTYEMLKLKATKEAQMGCFLDEATSRGSQSVNVSEEEAELFSPRRIV